LAENVRISRAAVREILPHGEPFVFVDEVIELEPGHRIVATLEDLSQPVHQYWMKGHFPGYPVVPGAILLEALAQAGAVALLSSPEHRGKIVLLAGVDKWRFRQPVQPGDPVHLEATITRMRLGVGWGHMRALTPEGKVVAEGDLSFAIVPRPAEGPGAAPPTA
jgi:3-hydroxyacyl-[acyl-carrier-protein] dehydratase